MSRCPTRLVRCAALGVALLLLAACEENDIFVPERNGSPDGIDRDAILNDVTEVRRMLMDVASQFSVDAIADVQFEDGRLTATVTEEVQGLDDAEAMCHDLSEAIAATDLEILVVDEEGMTLASCRFEA